VVAAQSARPGTATKQKDLDDEKQCEPPYGGWSNRSRASGRSCSPAERRASRRRVSDARPELNYDGNPAVPDWKWRRIQSHQLAAARHRPAYAILWNDWLASGRLRERAGIGLQWWHGRREICGNSAAELTQHRVRIAIRRRLRQSATL